MSDKFEVIGKIVVWTTKQLAATYINQGKVTGRIVVWDNHDQAIAHTTGNFAIKEDSYLEIREDGSREERE